MVLKSVELVQLDIDDLFLPTAGRFFGRPLRFGGSAVLSGSFFTALSSFSGSFPLSGAVAAFSGAFSFSAAFFSAMISEKL